MYNDEDPAQSIHTQGDEPSLTFGVRVLDGGSQRIAQCLLRMSEAHSVLAKVDSCLLAGSNSMSAPAVYAYYAYCGFGNFFAR